MPNSLLTELTPEKARETITEKMRKDLKEAFTRAAEHNDLDTYKDMLKQFQDELIAKQQAAATPKKSKKGKGKASDDDVDMEDVDDTTAEKAKSKKRKAEDDVSVSTTPACLPGTEILTMDLRHHKRPTRLRSQRLSSTPRRPRLPTALPRPKKNLRPKPKSRSRSLLIRRLRVARRPR